MSAKDIRACLKDLSPPTDELLEEMRSYCQVTRETVHTWFNGTNPTGMNKLSLCFFLVRKGYEVFELQPPDSIVVELGKVIIEGKISYDEANTFLGITTKDYLTRILLGQRIPSKKVMEKIRQVLALFPVPIKIIDKKAVLTVTEILIDSLSPLLELVLSDSFTQEDRKDFRERNPEKVFNCANKLNRLCSETARKNMEGKKHG